MPSLCKNDFRSTCRRSFSASSAARDTSLKHLAHTSTTSPNLYAGESVSNPWFLNSLPTMPLVSRSSWPHLSHFSIRISYPLSANSLITAAAQQPHRAGPCAMRPRTAPHAERYTSRQSPQISGTPVEALRRCQGSAVCPAEREPHQPFPGTRRDSYATHYPGQPAKTERAIAACLRVSAKRPAFRYRIAVVFPHNLSARCIARLQSWQQSIACPCGAER